MATDFGYENRVINAGGPIKPSGKDMPGDPRTRVNTFADIANIPVPYIGMPITVLQDETNDGKMTDYIVKSLKANSLGAPNSLVDQVQRYVDYLGAGSVSQDDINTAVNNYLTENPVQSGATAEQAAQIEANKNDIINIKSLRDEEFKQKIISDILDGVTPKYVTKSEYDSLSEEEKNNNSIEYHITDHTEDVFSLSKTNNMINLLKNGIVISSVNISYEDFGELVLSENELIINEGESGTFKIQLDKAPTNPETITLTVNNSNCTVSPESIVFTSDNYNIEQEIIISTVSDSSSYEDKNSIITLSNDNITEKTINITIKNTDEIPTVSVTGITLEKETSSMMVGDKETLFYTIIPTEATNKNVTWETNNSNIATVSDNGEISALSEGEAIITVTTIDGNYSDNCTITITPNEGNLFKGFDNEKFNVVSDSNTLSKTSSMYTTNCTSWATVASYSFDIGSLERFTFKYDIVEGYSDFLYDIKCFDSSSSDIGYATLESTVDRAKTLVTLENTSSVVISMRPKENLGSFGTKNWKILKIQ